MSGEAHGGLNLAELRAAGLDPDEVLDFSVNVNPFGPAPGVRAALAALDITRYPDRETLHLRTALAEANGVAEAQILIGNGAAELIWLAAHALLRAGDTALIPWPTFGEYARAARAVGARVIEVKTEPPGFRLNAEQFVDAIRAHHPRVVFLCNPNNPTGQVLDAEETARIAAACGNAVLILDEAYRSFTGRSPFGPPPHPNTLVLRSMTKDFALAGLRLGYALAEPRTIAALRARQPPWAVSAAAQVAGQTALADITHLRSTLALTRQAAGALRSGLAAAGARVNKSQLHFLLIEVGDGAAWRARLLQRGLLVRNCASFGLPNHVRVGARRPEENRRLIHAWMQQGNT